MVRFRDLKFPKELSKKKKLELYKCWILAPLDKGSEQRGLDLNWVSDRYGLSEKAAVAVELNRIGLDAILPNSNDLVQYFHNKCFVILKIVLLAGTMDEPIIVPPENASLIDTDPHYDPVIGALNATVRYRTADMEIKNYALTDISIDVDPNTNILNVASLEFQEQVINHSVTGGR